jgi:hypothetical protein
MKKERKPLPESANQASGQDRGMHRARPCVCFFNQLVGVIFRCCIRDYLSLPGDARRRVSARTPMNRAFPLSFDGDRRSGEGAESLPASLSTLIEFDRPELRVYMSCHGKQVSFADMTMTCFGCSPTASFGTPPFSTID